MWYVIIFNMRMVFKRLYLLLCVHILVFTNFFSAYSMLSEDYSLTFNKHENSDNKSIFTSVDDSFKVIVKDDTKIDHITEKAINKAHIDNIVLKPITSIEFDFEKSLLLHYKVNYQYSKHTRLFISNGNYAIKLVPRFLV